LGGSGNAEEGAVSGKLSRLEEVSPRRYSGIMTKNQSLVRARKRRLQVEIMITKLLHVLIRSHNDDCWIHSETALEQLRQFNASLEIIACEIQRQLKETKNAVRWLDLDGFDRIERETNNVIRRIAYGRMNGAATHDLNVTLDGRPLPVNLIGTARPSPGTRTTGLSPQPSRMPRPTVISGARCTIPWADGCRPRRSSWRMVWPSRAQPKTINSYFDPSVEFLELGVRIAGKTTMKVYGTDLNGSYGGMSGTGGLDGLVNDLGGFDPVLGMRAVSHRLDVFGVEFLCARFISTCWI
jgi:hypothetical protein